MNVRAATTDDVDVIARVLAAAFADYAWTRWTVDADDHERRVEALQRQALTELTLPYGEAWVATDDVDQVVSAALWMRPDVAVPDEVWERMALTQAELEGDRHAVSVEAEAACAPLRPREPHYFLGAVGTLPSHRRRGFAAAVLRPVLDRADRAYLETCGEQNVRFYEALGFTTTAEIIVPNGGPATWAMTR